MHIFVADEHPLVMFANTCRRALTDSALRRLHSVWAGERGSGERAQTAAVLRFLEGPASRCQLTNRAATISDGSAAFQVSATFEGGRQVRSLTLRGERLCDQCRRFDKHPSRGFVVFRSADEAAITHTTTNLNLRAGPGTHHRVKAIIPAGAPIDIESCGDTWCYMAWAGHVGYVKASIPDAPRDAEVPPLIHVTHVHKHGLINFVETVPSDAKGTLCRAGCGLCSRACLGARPEPSPPPAPAAPAEAPPPDGRRRKSRAYTRPVAQLVGTWAYSAADCERLFQRRGGGWAYRQPVDKFAQAAIVECRRKSFSLPPSAGSRAHP